jgi:hypothetical protein
MGTRTHPTRNVQKRALSDARDEPEPHLPFGNQEMQELAASAPVPSAALAGLRNQTMHHSLAGLGNHAVQRALAGPAQWNGARPLQRAPKNAGELLDMTVGEFAEQRKTAQMDWANATGFDDTTRSAVWEIVEWGLEGLSEIKLRDAAKEVAKGGVTVRYIKEYQDALNGQISGVDTIRLAKVNKIDDAVSQGKWIRPIMIAMGGGSLIRAVLPLDVFKRLIADETVATAFVDYFKSYKPTFQAPNGKDTESFITLVETEKAKIADYAAELTSIRNYHKFPKASLEKLKTDKTSSGKPLTLIFQSLFDHNGAFIRHEHVNKVIQNSKIRTFLVEGRSEADLKKLSASGIQSIAATYGLGGKITQVMVAGHGEATSIQMGGSGTSVGQFVDTGEYATIEKDGKPVSFAEDEPFWTTFFEALLKNMETKGGLRPTILLRACLTSSNSIDVAKLKAELKSTGTIDVDDSSIDPTTDENQVKIRAGIVDYIKAHGSLAKVLGDKAAGRADVLGAQASITAGSTGSIEESTGQLQIIALSDPKVAAPKIEYVREGKEPLGAIRAVIESWAEDKDRCFVEMGKRVKDPIATDDEFIIQLLFRTILAQYSNNILKANSFTDTANMLHGIAAGGAECRARNLHGDVMTQVHRNDFYPLLLGAFASKFAKLVILEDWADLDIAKRTDFVDLLGDPFFKRANVVDYLDLKLLDTHVDPILKLSGASLRGRIILALVGFIDADPSRLDCKAFLTSQVDVNQAFTPDVKAALGGYSEKTLRKALGLPVETVVSTPSVSSASGATDRPQNITGAKFHVESMPATKKEMNKSSLTDWAKLMSAPRDNSTELHSQYRTRDYVLVGTVKTVKGADAGWYMIKEENGTVGYMRKKYF